MTACFGSLGNLFTHSSVPAAFARQADHLALCLESLAPNVSCHQERSFESPEIA